MASCLSKLSFPPGPTAGWHSWACLAVGLLGVIMWVTLANWMWWKVVYGSCRSRIENPSMHNPSFSVFVTYRCITNHPKPQQFKVTSTYHLTQFQVRNLGLVFLGVSASGFLTRSWQSSHPLRPCHLQAHLDLEDLRRRRLLERAFGRWPHLLAGNWQKSLAPHHMGLFLHTPAWMPCGKAAGSPQSKPLERESNQEAAVPLWSSFGSYPLPLLFIRSKSPLKRKGIKSHLVKYIWAMCT